MTDRQATARSARRKARGPGRPSAASRAEALRAARRHLLSGEKLDVSAVAAELGLGRATMYRWFGTRELLVGEVLVAEFDAILAKAQAKTVSAAGAERVLATLDYANRRIAGSGPFRVFLEREGSVALALITSSTGPVQPKVIAASVALIEQVIADDGYQPPLETETLAYALVRLSEAFLYNDAVIGMKGDVKRLHDTQAALLGIPTQRRGSTPALRSDS
jgi:AcrR family transcriptional regulator